MKTALKAALITKPKILERQVKRFVAVCPFGGDGYEGTDAADVFNDRKPKTLHTTAASAEVEAVRHIREAHKDALTLAVVAKRRRQIVNETLELA